MFPISPLATLITLGDLIAFDCLNNFKSTVSQLLTCQKRTTVTANKSSFNTTVTTAFVK